MRTSGLMKPRARALGQTFAVVLTCTLAAPVSADAAGVLKVGTRGPRVMAVHKAFHLPASRVFRVSTQHAVERFQRRHGMTVDGIVGAETWQRIKRIRANQRSRSRSRHGARAHASARRGVLELGARSPRVAAMHKAFGMRPTRVFGAATRRAVLRLQRRHHLKADGIVGASTWKLVKRWRAQQRRHSGGAVPKRATHKRKTRRASRAGRVKLVQRALRLTADGVFGPATRAAVRRLQRRHKMPANGVVGPKVWDRLGHEQIRTVIHPDKRAVARSLVAGLIMARLPQKVRKVVAAAQRIATAPYRLGGGHGNWNDSGYDCSGSISYALWGGGLLSTALDSSGFMGWGAPGPGRWITIYANPGHAYMQIGRVRFDTSARKRTGSRWQLSSASPVGYVARHPHGL